MKISTTVATVGASALILAGTSVMTPAWGSSRVAHTNSKTLEIAIFHTYSGPNAAYGPEAAAGCFPAERIINAAGGVLGHQITCVPTDAKGDPADAVPAANRLIFSTTGQASFDRSTASYFWRILSPDPAQGGAMAAAAKKLGFTKVATVFGNDSSAQGSAPAAIAG